MKKEEYIKRYCEAAYPKKLEQRRAWGEAHPEKVREQTRAWYEAHPGKRREQHRAWEESHPEEVLAGHREQCRKGGKRYDKHLIYQHTGLRGARNKIRRNHARQYQQFKKIIAPDSQVHHQWIPETSEYTGVALVEADRHMHGFVDVIKVLKGEITLFTEKEIRESQRTEQWTEL
jgi:hypothetical protein